MKNNQDWDAEEVKTTEHDKMILYLMSNALAVLKNINPNVVEIEKIVTEVPIKTGYNNNFIVGYIDLIIKIKVNETFEHKHGLLNCYNPKDRNWIRPEDCKMAEKEKYQEVVDRVLYVEVKPNVDNFGNLIRQINKYKETTQAIGGNNRWVVYTKKCNKEIEKALNSQGVIVILKT